MWKLTLNALCNLFVYLNHRIVNNLIKQSNHSLITNHSSSSYEINPYSHANIVKSYGYSITTFSPISSVEWSTISSSNQPTSLSQAIYHHNVKLTLGLIISNYTWLDQRRNGNSRQWYYTKLGYIGVERSCTSIKGWCYARLIIGRLSSPKSQSMDMDKILL